MPALRSISESALLFISYNTWLGQSRQESLYRLFIGQIRVLGGLHQLSQIFVRIQAILNRRLDQAEYGCSAGGTLRRIGLPVNDEGLDTPSSGLAHIPNDGFVRISAGPVQPPIALGTSCPTPAGR